MLMEVIIITKKKHAMEIFRAMYFLGCSQLFCLIRLCPERKHREDSERVSLWGFIRNLSGIHRLIAFIFDRDHTWFFLVRS